ncbi:MAG: Crp/Fnr family transcriptional regulator [Flavobacteriaceae bacterium]
MGKCHQCIIRHFNSFKSLSTEELTCISDSKTEMIFKKGQVVFTEGSSINGVFCVKSGKCKLSKLNSNGKEQIVRFVKGGDVLGYRSVIADEPVTLTVTALDDMNACFIPKSDIFEALEKNPKFIMDMMKTACSDLKDANMTLSKMAQKNVRERLADTLLFLEETFDITEDGYIDVQLSREEISSIIGTATESAIRLLSGFKKERLINLKGKRIQVLDAQKLRNISEGF